MNGGPTHWVFFVLPLQVIMVALAFTKKRYTRRPITPSFTVKATLLGLLQVIHYQTY